MLNYTLTEVPLAGERSVYTDGVTKATRGRLQPSSTSALKSAFTAWQLLITSCSAMNAEKTIKTFAESFKNEIDFRK